MWQIDQGDCLELLRTMPEGLADSLVTDPPAGIGFMGREWDTDKGGRGSWIDWLTAVMQEAFRVLKPGAHGLVWAIPRTSHWTATALEDAGFEIRDVITAHFGSGFPKSQDVRKAAIKSGIACDCQSDGLQYPYERASENMHGMRTGVATDHPISSGEEQDLFAPMRGSSGADSASDASQTPSGLPDMRNGDSTEEPPGTGASALLFASVLCEKEGQRPGIAGASSSHVGEQQRENPTGEGLAWSEESCVEGRRDLQAGQGQLPRPEVCSLSGTVPGHGSDGRICNGTPARDGTVDRPVPEPDGSSSPQGPQSAQQLAGQPRTLADQSGSQAGRSWPMCNRCSKPILPEGLGTALKPATEHWILVRKPLAETSIARNVLAHGTGALNIDESRVTRAEGDVPGWHKTGSYGREGGFLGTDTFKIRDMSPEEVQARCGDKGRWPTNLLLSHDETCGFEDGDCAPDCPVAELDRQSGASGSGSGRQKISSGRKSGSGTWVANQGMHRAGAENTGIRDFGDSGGASRFFPTFHYFAKPSRSEREAGLDQLPDRTLNRVNPGGLENEPRFAPIQVKNNHPTVKGKRLMAWLIKLVTPPGGTVLDPFAGSGSTGVAAVANGFRFWGMEQNEEYVEIARKRLEFAWLEAAGQQSLFDEEIT